MLSGPNGEGKTNLAEAIGYVATLGSHRVATDAPLVRQGAERAIIRAAITSGRGNALIEIELNPGRANRVRLNRAPLPRPREILGVLRTVLFAPEDLALVKGDPGERRRFLDDLLVATAPRYAAVRTDYERVVRQRTALLKSAGARMPRGRSAASSALAGASFRAGAPEGRCRHCRRPWRATLDAWDDQLARAGTELLTARLCPRPGAAPARRGGLRGRLRGSRARRASPTGRRSRCPRPARPGDRSGRGGAAVPGRTRRSADLEKAMRDALQQARPGELERGVCLVGPHRDELELRVGELPARGYASHGESWSLALALRLAAYELLRADGEDPVLILDDVFAELDVGPPRPAGHPGRRGGAGHRDRRGAGRRARHAGRGPLRRRRRERSPVPADGDPALVPRAERLRRAAAALADVIADARARGEWPSAGRPGAAGQGGRSGLRHGRSGEAFSRPRRARRDDPQPLAAAIGGLLSDQGWKEQAAVGSVFSNWAQIVGPDLAAHTRPDGFAGRRARHRGGLDRVGHAGQVARIDAGPQAQCRTRGRHRPPGQSQGPTGPRQRGGWRVPGSRGHGDTYG